MSIAGWFCLAALALVVLLLFGATMELHRQVLQLRLYVGLVDNAQPLDFNADYVAPGALLPRTVTVGDEERAAVLVLSDGCTTCGDVAARLPAALPENLVVLVESRSKDDAAAWLATYNQTLGAQVLFDDDREIASALGVSASPASVRFDGLRAVAASTMPSGRQLERLLEWLTGQDAMSRDKWGVSHDHSP